MQAALGPVQLDDELGKSIDHRGLLPEPWSGIDHTENPKPRRYPIEIAQRALEASENRKRRKSGRLPRLLERDFGSYFSQRRCERSVGVLRSVAGNVRPVAMDSNPGKRQLDPCRQNQRLGKAEPEVMQFRFDPRH